MTEFLRNATDKSLRAWLIAGSADRGLGDGVTFVATAATAASAQAGKAYWILRYRFGGRQKEKVIGRYSDISLKDARELVRVDRAQLQQGIDVADAKTQREALFRMLHFAVKRRWIEINLLMVSNYRT